MPKISRHGGPSYEPAKGEGEAFAEQLDDQFVGEPGPELVELPAAANVERTHPGTGQPGRAVEAPADGTEHELAANGDDVKGGEQGSPGSSSSTSTAKPKKSGGPSKPSPQRRAPSTGNRSKPAPTESSSAASTAGSGPETAPHKEES